MADWQRRGDTRDPSIILEERENRICSGCAYLGRLWGMAICSKHDKHAKHRCKDYKEIGHG